MSAPVLSCLFHARRESARTGAGPAHARPLSLRRAARPSVRAVRLNRSAQSDVSRNTPSSERPLGPSLRANPCPEVTDPFCRLPLSTLSHRPESAKLGDLMRLLVRAGVRISHATGFSRAVGSAPDSSKIKLLSQPPRPIAGQTDSRAWRVC